MNYTKGRAGPVSTHAIVIDHFRIEGPDQNPMLKAVATISLRTGKRSVGLIAQGQKARALRDSLAVSNEIRAEVRWTGREAVTVTKLIAA